MINLSPPAVPRTVMAYAIMRTKPLILKQSANFRGVKGEDNEKSESSFFIQPLATRKYGHS